MRDFSFLNQKGPKTLNAVNKKHYFKNIEFENMHIRKKITDAKSNYSIDALSNYNSRYSKHKNILLVKSPSIRKMDPLIDKVKSAMNRQIKVKCQLILRTY